jgi:hypothetical protein
VSPSNGSAGWWFERVEDPSGEIEAVSAFDDGRMDDELGGHGVEVFEGLGDDFEGGSELFAVFVCEHSSFSLTIPSNGSAGWVVEEPESEVDTFATFEDDGVDDDLRSVDDVEVVDASVDLVEDGSDVLAVLFGEHSLFSDDGVDDEG